MVGSKKHHIHQTRQYTLPHDAPIAIDKIMDALDEYMKEAHRFSVKRKTPNYSRGNTRGAHVNFVPKFELQITPAPSGSIVSFDYYLKEKLGSAVTMGILTFGFSAAVGAGVMSVAAKEGHDATDKFWQIADSLFVNAPFVVLRESLNNAVIKPPQQKMKDGAAVEQQVNKRDTITQPPTTPIPPPSTTATYALYPNMYNQPPTAPAVNT